VGFFGKTGVKPQAPGQRRPVRAGWRLVGVAHCGGLWWGVGI